MNDFLSYFIPFASVIIMMVVRHFYYKSKGTLDLVKGFEGFLKAWKEPIGVAAQDIKEGEAGWVQLGRGGSVQPGDLVVPCPDGTFKKWEHGAAGSPAVVMYNWEPSEPHIEHVEPVHSIGGDVKGYVVTERFSDGRVERRIEEVHHEKEYDPVEEIDGYFKGWQENDKTRKLQ